MIFEELVNSIGKIMREIEDRFPPQFKRMLKAQAEEDDKFDPNVICPLKRSGKIKRYSRAKR